MSSIAVAGIVFACIFVGALVAMRVGRALPAHHLSGESKDVVKLGLGVIATLTALVLGLLIASAKGTYDTQNTAVKQMSANVLLLDRLLARYGPQTKEVRELLRAVVAASVARLWPEEGHRVANLAPDAARPELEAFYTKIAELAPKNDVQRALQARARDVAGELEQSRLRLFTQKDSSIPRPFLVVLVFWLVILFAGYGLLAPRNATVVVVLLVCALSIAGALFLILEMDKPFEGVMRLSSAPVHEALSRLGE